MKKEIRSFDKFLEKAFPLKDPFLRSDYGYIHNTIKWISIRAAYVLQKIGISANALDIFGLFLVVPCYCLLYFSLEYNKLLIFFISYLSILLILSIDFMDGMLSKLNKYKFEVGNDLDNLCPDVIKFFSFFVIGYLSKDALFMIISIFNCIIMYNFINKSTCKFPIKYHFIKRILYEKYAITSFRVFVALLLPSLCFFNFYNTYLVIILSKVYIFVLFCLSITWILILLKRSNLNERK